MYYTAGYRSPLGGITLASDGERLTGLWFDGQKYFADNLPEEHEEKDLPVFAQTRQWLTIYFSGQAPDFIPPLSMDGISPFRRRVWEILLTIPFGRVSTYGAIAGANCRRNGKEGVRTGCRRRGRAQRRIAHHTVPPRNRYERQRYGLCWRGRQKLALLKMEGADVSALFVPKRGTAL